jgi:hypothetical protein
MEHANQDPVACVVERLSGDTLAYAGCASNNSSFSFTPDLVETFSGMPFSHLGIGVGTQVLVSTESTSGLVTRVRIMPERDIHRAGSAEGPDLASIASPIPAFENASIQARLLPNSSSSTSRRIFRGIAPETRAFGKLVDTEPLRAGDLMLSCPIAPDKVSRMISAVQTAGGYSNDDARWTHAAMYVGDGASVIEATFDTILDGSVRLTSLDDYSQGFHIIRFRRPKYVLDERHGWRVCVRALARLGASYDFLDALRMWYQVRIRRKTLAATMRLQDCPTATVCSTLYADAYNEATGRRLGEIYGSCVPAWLSLSDQFEDVQTSWIKLC